MCHVVVVGLDNLMKVLVGVVLSLPLHQFNCVEMPGLLVGVIWRGPGGLY